MKKILHTFVRRNPTGKYFLYVLSDNYALTGLYLENAKYFNMKVNIILSILIDKLWRDGKVLDMDLFEKYLKGKKNK